MRFIIAAAVFTAALAVAIPLASSGTNRAQKAPYACTRAIHEARVVGHLAAQGFGLSASLIPLIPEAAQAGYNQDAAALDAITAKLNASTAKFKRLSKATTLHVTKFNIDAAICK